MAEGGNCEVEESMGRGWKRGEGSGKTKGGRRLGGKYEEAYIRGQGE